ncbi:MAG: hypothetical protein O3A21_06665, partial [Proteobacteria bacterium]|nr:hypothetical protein [Pseudomonadota bacterium]
MQPPTIAQVCFVIESPAISCRQDPLMAKSNFRRALEEAVLERHCANHPMTEKWAKGDLGQDAMMGWGVEHYHWVHNYHIVNFTIAAKAPRDVIEMQLENFREEADDDKPHIEIVLKFAAANGADIDRVRNSRGLPTTRAWRNWLFQTARDNHWVAGGASTTI